MQEGFFEYPPDQYHADPCDVPSLSASIAHVLDRQSPLHAYTQHPRLGGVARAHKPCFDSGSLIHALLLGQGKDIAVVDARDYRTKQAQGAREQARSAGKVPVTSAEHEQAMAVATRLRARFATYGIQLDGQSEATALWVETAEDGTPVQCRGMMDHVKEPVIYDLKSCRSAHPEACRRHIDEYGYAIQRAAYVSAVEHLRPAMVGRVEFVFLFFELEPPYAVTPVRLSGQFRELGERRWRRAVNIWARCLSSGEWPGYVESVTELEPMPWALTKDMERQMSAARSTYLDDLPI